MARWHVQAQVRRARRRLRVLLVMLPLLRPTQRRAADQCDCACVCHEQVVVRCASLGWLQLVVQWL